MALNPYEDIIGGTLPDEARIQALASKLRGSDDRAMLAMLSGDDVLSGVGNQMMANNQNRSLGLQKSRDAISNRAIQEKDLEGKMKYRELQRQTNELERQRQIQQHQQSIDFKNESIKNRDMVYQQAQDQLKERLALEERQKEEQKVKDFQEQLKSEGILDVEQSMASIDFLTKDYITVGPGGVVEVKGDIPGMGATGNLPAIMLSQEGSQIQAAMAALANRILKERSGAAVTTPEMQRLAKELQTGLLTKDSKVMTQYMALKKHTNGIREAMREGYTITNIADLRRLDTAAATYNASINSGETSGRTNNGTLYEVIE